MKIILFIAISIYSSLALCRLRIAFFEAHYINGSRVELTPGSMYYHVAIEIGGKWYHTSPSEGVTVLPRLNSFADIRLVEMLEHKDLKVMYKDIKPYLHMKFDYTYTWKNTDSTYCSKFIAQLLDIEPTEMHFTSPHWKLAKGIKKFSLGISPDSLFETLIDKGFDVLPLKTSVRKKTPLTCKSAFAT